MNDSTKRLASVGLAQDHPNDDVMPLLHHICNIFTQVIKSIFSKLMKIVI